MRVRRTAVALTVVAVATSACGYNTNDHEIAREVVMEQAAARPAVVAPSAAPGVAAPQTSGDAPSTAASPGSNQVGAQPGPAVNIPGTGPVAPADPGQPTAADQPTAPANPSQPADPGTGEQPTDTRPAPPGGNGGATDVGVTETSITITNAVDRTGAVPGLFQDAQEAVQAYVLKFQSEEGTVYGRSLELVPQDTKLSNQGNRTAYLDACQIALASVGSVSAFEQGGVEPVRECGLPDLKATVVSPEGMATPQVRSILAQSTGIAKIVELEYFKEQWPGAEAHAAFLFIDAPTTRYQVNNITSAAEQALGYTFRTYPIALSEVNYASYIQQLKDTGARIVIFQGAYQQAARLAKTMQQQNYQPDVFFLQSNAYQPGLIEEGGAEMEGFTILGQTGALVEELDRNPEMQEYAAWLARVNPRAKPTGLGMFAWAATELFVESLKAIGPEVTRQGLLDHINATYTDFTGNGLFPAQNIATQYPNDCIVMADVTAGGFVRRLPADDGYICSKNGPVEVQ